MRTNPVFLTLCLTLLSLSGGSLEDLRVTSTSERESPSVDVRIASTRDTSLATTGKFTQQSSFRDSLVSTQDQPVDYARDIRPLLANKCGSCHGADERSREAGLRLDTREGATGLLPSGSRAVVPGDPEARQLLHRI
ncbi:MAG TPA: hypothetical protein DCF63_14385, partial [Planctomycetaceae bacterium]|nr:hypothetical protein [Planctomycetaceae bacterium]